MPKYKYLIPKVWPGGENLIPTDPEFKVWSYKNTALDHINRLLDETVPWSYDDATLVLHDFVNDMNDVIEQVTMPEQRLMFDCAIEVAEDILYDLESSTGEFFWELQKGERAQWLS